MEFTHEQISEIISEITNGEQGLQGLGEQEIFMASTYEPQIGRASCRERV